MARFDMIALFREAALSVENKTYGDLTFETPVESLALDSVAMIEILGYIEEQTGTRLSDEDVSHVLTLGELAELVEREAD
jgi:acyl carrier protein